MSEFTNGFAEALGEIDSDEDLIPCTFTWGSVSNAPCTVTGANKGGNLDPFGREVTRQVTVVIRRDLLGDAIPNEGQTFTANGVIYGVESVTVPAGSPFVKIMGVSNTRGA
jgi:hypothetical protein